MKLSNRAIIAVGLLFVSALSHEAALAAPKKKPKARVRSSISRALEPCTSNEEWMLGARLPSTWEGAIVDRMIDPAQAPELLLQAADIRAKAKDAEMKVMAEYAIARSLFARKLVPTAFESFSRIVVSSRGKGTEGIRLAALSCMNEIHRLFPSIEMPSSVIEASKELLRFSKHPVIRETVHDAVAEVLLKQIARGQGAASFQSPFSLLKGSTAHEDFIRVMVSARGGQETNLIRFGERFLSQKALPASLEKRRDLVRLLVGEAHYGQRRWDQALGHLKQVSNASNYAAQALTARAWTHLLKKEFGQAAGSAHNMLIGGLKSTFSPEAGSIVAMSLVENCRYAEALEAVKFFKKRYGKSYRWLNAFKTKNIAPQGLYKTVASYLTKEASVPERVATEWLRSPVFLGNQTEINLLLDAQSEAQSLANSVAQILKGPAGKGLLRTGRPIHSLLVKAKSDYLKREAALIREINLDLANRSRDMMADLVEVSENMRLVEAEVYNLLGEKMIADQAGGAGKLAGAKKDDGAKHASAGPVWDWGRFPASAGDEDETEIWEDEIGFLKADVTSNCGK